MKSLTRMCLALLIGVLSGCVQTRELDPEDMYTRAAALTKLTAAAESYIRYGNPDLSRPDSELLAEATKGNPQLLSNLGDYRVRLLSRDRHAVVLVCTKNGDRALLEDTACTAQPDKHHWKQSAIPCAFTVSAAEVCTNPQRAGRSK